jgi:drug/metabolite transporter (DMT)-like permease
MIWLAVVSLVWAFSFGLIKTRFEGIDPSLIGFIRLVLSLAVFAPFLRVRGLRGRDVSMLMGIGAVQFGLMYISYIASYQYLEAHIVALWTIFTPLFVCLFDDVLSRRIRLWPVLAAGIAVVGAGIVKPLEGDELRGIVLVQVSNVCFAAGQVAYRRWRRSHREAVDAKVFALPYLGAVLATLPFAATEFGGIAQLGSQQWLTLAYLGVIAAGTLAVFNNAKIPLAVACSLLFFGGTADLVRLLIGGGIVVAAGVFAEWSERRAPRVDPDPAPPR